jgi:hypothetical protein
MWVVVISHRPFMVAPHSRLSDSHNRNQNGRPNMPHVTVGRENSGEEVNRALVDSIAGDEPTAVGMAKAIVAA